MWCTVFKTAVGQVKAVLGRFDSYASPPFTFELVSLNSAKLRFAESCLLEFCLLEFCLLESCLLEFCLSEFCLLQLYSP